MVNNYAIKNENIVFFFQSYPDESRVFFRRMQLSRKTKLVGTLKYLVYFHVNILDKKMVGFRDSFYHLEKKYSVTLPLFKKPMKNNSCISLTK